MRSSSGTEAAIEQQDEQILFEMGRGTAGRAWAVDECVKTQMRDEKLDECVETQRRGGWRQAWNSKEEGQST